MNSEADRRAHPRAAADVGCKVLRANVARYLAARSRDVSRGGALLELRTPSPLAHGESLDIGLAWTGEAMLPRGGAIRARVVRATPLHAGIQRVAVVFENPQIEADHHTAGTAATQAA